MKTFRGNGRPQHSDHLLPLLNEHRFLDLSDNSQQKRSRRAATRRERTESRVDELHHPRQRSGCTVVGFSFEKVNRYFGNFGVKKWMDTSFCWSSNMSIGYHISMSTHIIFLPPMHTSRTCNYRPMLQIPIHVALSPVAQCRRSD